MAKVKMKHELKIIMSFDTEKQDSRIKCENLRVFVDDNIIGCIQKLNISANAQSSEPNIEFSFPDFKNLDFDLESYNQLNTHNYDNIVFTKEIDYHIENLKLASNVKITMENIDDNVSSILVLDEVGTDGHIDSIPMKRRHK